MIKYINSHNTYLKSYTGTNAIATDFCVLYAFCTHVVHRFSVVVQQSGILRVQAEWEDFTVRGQSVLRS